MMSKLLFILLCLLPASGLHAQEDFEWTRPVPRQKGKVVLSEDREVAMIFPDENPNMRYISRELPPACRVQDLVLEFSGTAGKIPPYIRMLGTPLRLDYLKVSRADRKRLHLRSRVFRFKHEAVIQKQSDGR